MAVHGLFSTHPGVAGSYDTDVCLGTEFDVTTACELTAIRYPQPGSGEHLEVARTVAVYRVDTETTGTLVAGPYTTPTPVAGQWCTYTLSSPVPLPVGTYRVVVLHLAAQGYCATTSFFTTGDGSTDLVDGPITRVSTANAVGARQGSYKYNGSTIAYTSDTYSGACYYSDVIVQDAAGSNDGTLAAATTLPTSTITGTQTNAGALSATVPLPTASLLSAALEIGAPTSYTATPLDGSTIRIDFTVPAPGDRADLRRDGVIIASDITGGTYTDTGLAPGVTYTYELRSVQ